MKPQAYIDAIESLASAIEKLPGVQYIPGHVVVGIRYDSAKHKTPGDLTTWRLQLDKYWTAIGGHGGVAGIPYTCTMLVTGPEHLRAIAAHLKHKVDFKWMIETADRTDWIDLIPAEVKLSRNAIEGDEEEITEVQLLNVDKETVRSKQLKNLPKEKSNDARVDPKVRFQQFIDSLGIQQTIRSARDHYVAIKLKPSDYARVAECNFLYSIRRMGTLTLRKS